MNQIIEPPKKPAEPIEMRFGRTVAKFRRAAGLTQENLAGDAGLHRTYIADIERGGRNVSLRAVEKIAKGLRKSVAELFPQEEA